MNRSRPTSAAAATTVPRPCAPSRCGLRQRGVAAIEFAFVITLFLILAVAIMGFSTVLWGQQVLTSAASEGARAALDASQTGAAATSAACPVASSQSSWLTPTCQVATAACAWRNADGTVPSCVTVSLSYDLTEWPLMAVLNQAAAAFHVFGGPIFPTALAANAVVQIQ